MRNAVLSLLLMTGTLGCSVKALVPGPIRPKRPVPPGTLLVTFTKKVQGPLDLAIDGTRIPVQQEKKSGTQLVVTGLAPGKHTYFLTSPVDAFGFDQGTVEIRTDEGTFLPLFAQHFKATLYGKPEPTPPAAGLPGVTARLLP